MTMRRGAAWAGVVALAALAAGSARWPVDPASVAASLNASFGRTGAMTWNAPKEATFSALPWPGLRIVDAALDSASGVNLVSAPEARVDLSLIGLMMGRMAPAQLTLTAPTITLDLDRPPFTARPGTADVVAAIAGLGPFGRVNLSNGVVRVTSRTRGLDTVIESVRGRCDGSSPASRVSVDLSAIWRGAPLVLSGALEAPHRAAFGMPSPLNLRMSSFLGDFAFSGTLTAGAKPGALGNVLASSHAIAQIGRLLGVAFPPTLDAADIAISGKIKATPEDVVFDEATVTSGGQVLQGALRLARDQGRLALSGSLDAERLSLTPLLGPAEPLRLEDGRWSEKSFSVAPPRNFDLDLRLSVGRLDAYGLALDNVAASALLKGGALAANLVDASAYGGRGQGELHLASDGSDFRLAMRGKLADADLGAAASRFGLPIVTGKGDADLSVKTVGRSPAELISGLEGTASLALAEGAVSGVNLEEALRRSQRRPLDVTRDMRSGGTTFEQMTADIVIRKGVAHMVNGALGAGGLKADLQGDIDLGGQSWRLRLNAAQTDRSGAIPPDAARLSLDIDGPWSNTTVTPVDEADKERPGSASTP
jgi:AsmA protein